MLAGNRTSTNTEQKSGTMLGPRSSHSRPRPADDAAHEEERQVGQVGIGSPRSSQPLERRDDLRHLADGVDALLLREMWAERPITWTASWSDAGVLGDDVTRAVGLGHDRDVRAHAVRSTWTVPTPPWSSPTTHATRTSPRSGTPARRAATAAITIAATPPFML